MSRYASGVVMVQSGDQGRLAREARVLSRLTVMDKTLERPDIADPIDQRVDALSRLVGQPITFACLRNNRGLCASQDDAGACRVCVARELLGRLGPSWTVGKLRRALLLCDQPPVEPAFFRAFFGDGEIDDGAFLEAIAQFRAYAMLAFGNFRFAFKRLATAGTEDEIRAVLGRWSRTPGECRRHYETRPGAGKLVRPIPQDHRWLLGYLSGRLMREDLALEAALRRRRDGGDVTSEEAALIDAMPNAERAYWTTHLDEAKEALEQIERDQDAAVALGIANTVAYLAANSIDIYVATSMRQRWEFEATAALIDDVMGRIEREIPGLTHFDPTLSFTRDRIDKGLIEGLMLHRASVTIYMAQELDTLGKDSELAATLARGNTVIAYVEQATDDQLRGRMVNAPLAYLRTRALQHLADERISAADAATVFRALDPEGSLATRSGFYLLARKDLAEAKVREELRPVVAALARAEAKFLRQRADGLQKAHPLALQIDQATGVANGVLVARTPEQCARLVVGAITNALEFDIIEGASPIASEPAAATLLIERSTQCPFRVVTNDETLTNAFWTFYK
jgi:hypothetical protein